MLHCSPQSSSVLRINKVSGLEKVRITALYKIKYNTSVPLLHLLLQFPQVFKPACGNGIGEIRDALLYQSAIFYLNETATTLLAFKQ
jgi:hypothetical protein